jgi:6-phosphogluconate dehydrogenase
MEKKEFGLVGLGVMGKSLSRNLAGKGYKLALFNRHITGKEEDVAIQFVSAFQELAQAQGFDDLKAFVQSLDRPRKIFLMVNAGAATDAVIEDLIPLLDPGDIIMDGGNSFYKDTQRRMERLAELGLHFLGCGVSGGEKGALEGPSIMPGGAQAAYGMVQPYLESIAAKDNNAQPCCTYIGNGGAGHFVKMVHNGIEYAEMQLIAEVYFILRQGMGYSPDAIAAIFEQWLKTDAASYLLEITVDILRVREGTGWLLDEVLDAASNKGTGGWATAAAAELGVPATMISEALFARYLSAFVKERSTAAQGFVNAHTTFTQDTDHLRDAYQLARIINHHQGIHLIDAASTTYHWGLNLPELARVWTNGCIIRSVLMEQLIAALKDTNRLLLYPNLGQKAQNFKQNLSETVINALTAGLEIPCLSVALNFLNGYTNIHSPMNIIQAQRDYFGAHTYVRRDSGSTETGGFISPK